MFQINDYVMYGTTGVCEVTDIVKQKNRDMVESEYYVLNPVYDSNTTIKIPVDNEKIIIRPVVSKSAIADLMCNPSEKEITWIENDRQRSSDFKEIIKAGDCKDLVGLVKVMSQKKIEKKAKEKKLNQTDMNIMKLAEKLVNEEFSVVLNISPDEVASYIKDNSSK